MVEEGSVESIGEERLYIQRNTGIVSNIGVITPKCAKKSDSSLEHGSKSIVLYQELLIVRPDMLVNDLVRCVVVFVVWSLCVAFESDCP